MGEGKEMASKCLMLYAWYLSPRAAAVHLWAQKQRVTAEDFLVAARTSIVIFFFPLVTSNMKNFAYGLFFMLLFFVFF